MNQEAQAVLRSALDLPEDERADLAGAILESLDSPAEPGVEEAWRREIAERVRQLDEGLVETIPWETVRASALAKLVARSRD